MENRTHCNCKEHHHSHICMLKSSGNTEEINKVTTDPKFYCFTCAAEANCAENLCDPVKVES